MSTDKNPRVILSKVWANAMWTEPASILEEKTLDEEPVPVDHTPALLDYAKRCADTAQAIHNILEGECNCPQALVWKTGGPFQEPKAKTYCIIHGNKGVWLAEARKKNITTF